MLHHSADLNIPFNIRRNRPYSTTSDAITVSYEDVAVVDWHNSSVSGAYSTVNVQMTIDGPSGIVELCFGKRTIVERLFWMTCGLNICWLCAQHGQEYAKQFFS
jgi:hypothetical protein